MLLLCGESVALPLQIIFTNILSTGIYPNFWKLANVTPIHKKSEKQKINNYRPISLLPICSKIFEKIIFNHLYRFLTTNNLITKKQSGFRPGDSTTNQLLDLIDTIHQSFDACPTLEVRAVFMDISKAFDKVWHEGLILKLKQNGVSGSLLKFFEDYLRNRKQRVVLNGAASDYGDIKSGVPQGSVLGPLLFLIYINDLEENIKSQIRFFADDTMLFSIVKDPALSANELNQDLETIRQWAHQWKLEFNPDPTKQATELLFSYKKKPPIHPPLFFNGNTVTAVDEHKHLGLILDKKLSFKSHVNEKITKTKKIIGMIKHLSKYLPIKTLVLMYKSLVRPHFDYCSIVFHSPPANNGAFDDNNNGNNDNDNGNNDNGNNDNGNSNNDSDNGNNVNESGNNDNDNGNNDNENGNNDNDNGNNDNENGNNVVHVNTALNALMSKIESVQYQAALAITGTWQGTSRTKLYKELGLESLSDRRSFCRVLQLFKIKNNLTPVYLREKLTALCVQDDPNANPNIYYEKRARTARYKNTFLPNAIASWNNIVTNIQGNITLYSLKNHILKIIRPKIKSFYDIHDPIGLHYLFQLRTGLSPLRSHKNRHKFRDTPTDICNCHQGIEDINHFLFECLQFAIHRATLAVDITNILLRNNLIELANDAEFYLYGHSRLSLIDNKKVLSSTIQYIKNTRRFSSQH